MKRTHVIHSPHLKTVHLWTVYCVSFCMQICKCKCPYIHTLFSCTGNCRFGAVETGQESWQAGTLFSSKWCSCNTWFPLLLHSREMLAAAGLPVRGFSSTLVSPISLLLVHMLCLYDFSPNSRFPKGLPVLSIRCAIYCKELYSAHFAYAPRP